MNKKLLFLFSMLSLVGLVFCVIGKVLDPSWEMTNFFTFWFILSLPLIVLLIYNKIFKEKY